MEAFGPDITTLLVCRCEETSSHNMVEVDQQAVECFWHHVNTLISDIPLVTTVKNGLML